MVSAYSGAARLWHKFANNYFGMIPIAKAGGKTRTAIADPGGLPGQCEHAIKQCLEIVPRNYFWLPIVQFWV
jgi:hypothetical protein